MTAKDKRKIRGTFKFTFSTVILIEFIKLWRVKETACQVSPNFHTQVSESW